MVLAIIAHCFCKNYFSDKIVLIEEIYCLLLRVINGSSELDDDFN